MEYSNLGIVTDVAIPYTSKVDGNNIEQKQIQQQSIQTTNTQNDKNINQSNEVTDSFRFSTISYQELPTKFTLVISLYL